jgi:hypothetical protein
MCAIKRRNIEFKPHVVLVCNIGILVVLVKNGNSRLQQALMRTQREQLLPTITD